MAQVALNTPAPDFVLKDYRGEEVRLSDFRGKQHVLLVFNRGFIWPFCREHMAQLRLEYDDFAARDTAVVVVGPEDVEKFRDYFTEHDLPYFGLPDPKHSVLKLYGQQVKIFKFGRMPAEVLIDKNGIARFVHYGNSMRDIPSCAEMITLVDELNKEFADKGVSA